MSCPLNIVQICDHLSWPGSRTHCVKRLFAWMIPCFDRDRFNVSLISLRQPDTSEDTLETRGIDVSLCPSPSSIRQHCRPCCTSSTGSRSTSCTCTATGRRPSGVWRPHAVVGPRCCADVHAVVSEDRRQTARFIHRPGNRGVAFDHRLRRERPPRPGRANACRLSRSAVRRVLSVADAGRSEEDT